MNVDKDFPSYSIKKINDNLVEECLRYLDDVYIPALSKRVQDFAKYVDKLVNFAENYMVYTNTGEIIGYIGFYINNLETKEAFISQLVVKNEYQKMGIGKKLLEVCFENAKNAEMESVKLEVRKDNVNAILFYKKIGFYITDVNGKTQYMKYDLLTDKDM